MWSALSEVLSSIFGVVLTTFIEEAKKPVKAEIVHSDSEEKSWSEEANNLWSE